MIALAAAIFVTFAALLIPNNTPFVRIWRPSFLMGALSAVGLMVTAEYFGFETMDPIVGLLYAGGLLAFLIGDALMSTLMNSGHSPDPGRVQPVVGLVRAVPLVYLYAVLALIGTVVVAFVYQQRSAMFNMFELGTALRTAEREGLSYYGAAHLMLFSGALGTVLILNRKLWVQVIGFALFLGPFFLSFVAVARTGLFFFMCPMAFLLYVRTRRLWPLLAPVSLLVIGTFLYAQFAGKETAFNGDSFFVWYAGYGIHAFDHYIFPLNDRDWGLNSFGAFGSFIHGGIEPEDLSVFGTEYNVYTFIGSPYRDFGVAGVILLPFLFGCLWSWVWNRTPVRPMCLMMYGWMVFPCIIPFFDWKFSLSSLVYLVFIYLILLRPQFGISATSGWEATPSPRPSLVEQSSSFSSKCVRSHT